MFSLLNLIHKSICSIHWNLILVSCILSSVQSTPEGGHPLDPLTSEDIARTTRLIRSLRPDARTYVFNAIYLREPPKQLLAPSWWNDQAPPDLPRKTFVVMYDKVKNRVFEAVVDLNAGSIDSWTPLPVNLVNPSFSYEDIFESERWIMEHPTIIDKCMSLGLNLSLVRADKWPISYRGDMGDLKDRRIVQVLFSVMNYPGDNEKAHPLDFKALADLNKKEIVELTTIENHDGFLLSVKLNQSAPMKESNFNRQVLKEEERIPAYKPLQWSAPEGAEYQILGNLVQWMNFQFRVSYNMREGVTLHQVSFKDHGRFRPIIYRAAISEIFVPYGDPSPLYALNAMFAEGEFGLGMTADRQVKDEDCTGAAYFMPAVFNNEKGEAVTIPNAMCIYEDDSGYMWKHTDWRTGQHNTARSRRLVVQSVATIGSFVYAFFWYFYLDATIDFEVKITGTLNTYALAAVGLPRHGTVVFPEINAPFHQHVFVSRIDFDIDGPNNTVATVDILPDPTPTGHAFNQYGQAIIQQKTMLKTALEGKTDTNAGTARTWNIINPIRKNPYSFIPVAYKLIPKNSAGLMLRSDSPIRRRAQFTSSDVWVTPYVENQLYAGGFYLNSSGIHEWVLKNSEVSIQNTDTVLWHTFGVTHIPRVEDWPIISTFSAGFKLQPCNFFTRNPAYNAPPLTWDSINANA